MSGVFFVSWLVAYDLVRMLHTGEAVFAIFYLLINIPIAVYLWVNIGRGHGKWAFAGLVVIFLITSVLIAVHVGGVHRAFTWLLVAVVLFGAAFAWQTYSVDQRSDRAPYLDGTKVGY